MAQFELRTTAPYIAEGRSMQFGRKLLLIYCGKLCLSSDRCLIRGFLMAGTSMCDLCIYFVEPFSMASK